MRYLVRKLPLALLGVIALLIQALAVGLGPGTRICVDPACSQISVAANDARCDGGCGGAIPETPGDHPCDCSWMPIPDQAHIGLAATSVSAPILLATVPPLMQLLPAAPARLALRRVDQRPPPHLAALRFVILTC